MYLVNVGRRKDKPRRYYVSFGDVYFEIEFIEACSSKFFVSLRKFNILRIEVKDMEKTC